MTIAHALINLISAFPNLQPPAPSSASSPPTSLPTTADLALATNAGERPTCADPIPFTGATQLKQIAEQYKTSIAQLILDSGLTYQTPTDGSNSVIVKCPAGTWSPPVAVKSNDPVYNGRVAAPYVGTCDAGDWINALIITPAQDATTAWQSVVGGCQFKNIYSAVPAFFNSAPPIGTLGFGNPLIVRGRAGALQEHFRACKNGWFLKTYITKGLLQSVPHLAGAGNFQLLAQYGGESLHFIVYCFQPVGRCMWSVSVDRVQMYKAGHPS